MEGTEAARAAVAEQGGAAGIKARIDRALERVGGALDVGGTRKDIALIAVSAVALIASFFAADATPFDMGWVAIVLCGAPIVVRAVIALVTKFDVKADVLVSIALLASVAIGQIFAAGEVAVIMQLGGLLEELTVARARAGIEHLVDLTPVRARVVANGAERMVAADEVRVGDVVRVLPGETVPVDGRIVRGTTSIDQAVMTGESLPQDKGPGDEVLSGTVNRFGAFDAEATRVGGDSSIQRMVALVQSADAGKARIVNIADRWATWIVVGALSAAAVTFLVTGEVQRAVTVLVVFCPCALVLATPTAIMAAIGNATKHGFLVREGDALERLATADRCAFDKTGTLTFGVPEVVRVESARAGGERELLALAAAAESRSEHPLAQAIVRAHEGAPEEPASFSMEPGRGVTAQVGGRLVRAGNAQLVREAGACVPRAMAARAQGFQNRGCSIVHVLVDGAHAGFVALSDTVRPEAAATVRALNAAGASCVLLTGDNAPAARCIADAVGIRDVRSDCLPADKLAAVEELERAGHRVCMIGDGVNDAPALKRSFVGIAMGGVGSDIAVDAADVVLVDDAVGELAHLVRLSKHMMTVIRANLTFSMTLNFVAIVLAVTAVLDPVSGALVHNCGSVFVIVNAAFLLRWKRGDAKRAA